MLKTKNIVKFKHNEFYYEIFLSADNGFIVNLYSNDENNNKGEYIEANLADGGLRSSTNEVDAMRYLILSHNKIHYIRLVLSKLTIQT